MEERIGSKELESLRLKREDSERGLREEAVVVNKHRDMCYVLLTDKSGQFHLHHYFIIGLEEWVVSYDVQCKSAIDTIKQLLQQLS